VHRNAKTYDEVIFNRCGHQKGRIINEETTREVTIKEAKQEEAERSSPMYISTHLGFVEEEEEMIVDKNRRDK
jgi:hypothetical protein